MKLLVEDENHNRMPIILSCCHCDNKGVVGAEDNPVVENNFTVAVPASLKRNEMTPSEKREHLRSLGVKDSADIEKIISEVFST